MKDTPPTPVPRNALAPTGGGLVEALMEEAHRAASSGRRQLARQRYEGALYLLDRHSDPALASTILRRVGRSYLDDGDLQAGLDCLEAAQAVAVACGNTGELAHTVNVLAISRVQRGQLEEAETLHHEAGRLARMAGDEGLIAMIEQNLGNIANTQGEPERALRHYESSEHRYRALGLREEVARLLNNIGMTLGRLERCDEAGRTYAEALALARACGDEWARMMVEVSRIGLLIQMREFASAQDSCDRILEEAEVLHETRLLAEAHKHAGVIAREQGRTEDAERLLRLAYNQAMEREDLLLAAETSREQAEVYLTMGRNRATLQSLGTSHRLFSQLRARQDVADVRRRMHHLEQRFESAVQQWAQNIESKDAYTAGHCERVADRACAIATGLGFDEANLFWFRVGALLHDVGKIVVHSDILNKPGPLTPEERREMEKHPAAGVELLRDIEFPWDVFPMIRGHHERWDGHGYPDRLAGTDIPLAARILCVADVYDALTSDRAYRQAFQPAEALTLMKADSGRAFDPEILAEFAAIQERETAPIDLNTYRRETRPERRPDRVSVADST